MDAHLRAVFVCVTALVTWVICGGAVAGELSGKVVAISDGDTLTVLDQNRRQHKIRLAEIDAPELKQPFGTQSRRALGQVCFRQSALVRVSGVDRYGREIGRVRCDGVDANAQQVRTGMAWVYDRYVTDRELYRLQEEARGRKAGLWSDLHAIPPWEWRARSRRR